MVVVKEAVPCLSSSVTSSFDRSMPLLLVPRVKVDSTAKASSMRGPNFSSSVGVKAANEVGTGVAIKPWEPVAS